MSLLAGWAPDAEGRASGDLAALGTSAYTAVIIIVNLKAPFTPAPLCVSLLLLDLLG